MKTIVTLFGSILVAFILQTSLFPVLFGALSYLTGVSYFSWLTFDAALLVVLYVAFRGSWSSAIIWAFCAAAVGNAFGLVNKGTLFAAYFVSVTTLTLLRQSVLLRDFASKFLFFATISLVYAFVFRSLGHLMSGSLHAIEGHWSHVTGQAIANGLLAPFVISVLDSLGVQWRESGRQRRMKLVYDL